MRYDGPDPDEQEEKETEKDSDEGEFDDGLVDIRVSSVKTFFDPLLEGRW